MYDSLTEENRAEPIIKFRQQLYPDGTMGEWHVQRDFYLARVAEALLPTRLNWENINQLRLALGWVKDNAAIDHGGLLVQINKLAQVSVYGK